MQDDQLTRLLQRFATAAKAHYQALETMDEERANTHAKMIAGLYQSIVASGEGSSQALLELVDNSDPVVAGMAAVYSIRCNSKRCLATLGRVALEPGLLGFRAQVAIERWENGEWQ
jgi:oligoribonuclease (3'-5' exoribonuclease)